MESGARIGFYEIVAKLGEGGMGVVYRARDTKLDRDVALKVLPELFVSDPERLARFEREAKVLASLNHPNIAQVYGFEGHAIAMEFVDGPTLEEIIRRPESGVQGPESAVGPASARPAFAAGPASSRPASAAGPASSRPASAAGPASSRPASAAGPASSVPSSGPGVALDQALAIMKQIALALEAAHDQGIIHRDLKPANVKVREDGTVKVLDFGLAKAFAADAESAASGVSNSPTLTARSTQLGMILGTAAYMAPEQAKGRAVDRRADVWAFGVVFFEVLAGRRAFEGDDVSEVLASVLKMEPEWSALPADLPGPVRRLLRRCLEKDPKKRLRDVAEGMLQLEEGLASGSTASMMMPAARDVAATAPVAPRSRWAMALAIGATAIMTAIVAISLSRWMTPAPPIPAATRFTFEVAPGRFNETNSRQDLAISPDGRMIVYSAIGQGSPLLHIRRLDQFTAAPLRGAESAIAPFFSADGLWVGFVDSGDQASVKKVSVLGGPAVAVCKVPATPFGATWTSDGIIVMGSPGGGLLRVSEAGGIPEKLTELDTAGQEALHVWPSAVPGTSLVLFVVSGGSRSPLAGGQLAVVDRTNGRTVRLGLTGAHPRYVSTGHVVYAVEDGSLRAVKFDVASLSISGNPVPVLDAVGVKASGAANFDVSNDGQLVYATGTNASGVRTLTWTDRSGRETPIAADARNYYYARVSPDGKRLSLDVRDQEEDIWIWDLVRENLSRLTDKAGADQYGLWTGDGQRVVFASVMKGRTELFWHRPDGVGQPEQITDTAAEKLVPFPNAITPDGKQVIFRATTAGKNDLFLADIGGDHKVRKLLATEHDERNAALSHDGKFMAFESDLSGRMEIYVRPFPDVESRQWPVSTAGGSKPVWAPNGQEIFYLSAENKLMAVSVRTAGGLELGKPTALFDVSSYFWGGAGRNFDVAPDGKRFIMVKEPKTGERSANPITVVLHWVDELRARLK